MRSILFMLKGILLLSISVQAQKLSAFRLDLQPYSLQCKMKVLEKMGWDIQYAPIDFPRDEENEDCSSTVKSKLWLPAQPNPEEDYSLPFLNRALRAKPTFCHYLQELKPAVQRATKSLQENHLYLFKPFWRNDNVRMSLMKETWQKQDCGSEKCYSAVSGQQANAVKQLTRSFFTSDCATGLMLAEYAIARELFGNQTFQELFSADEIYVGDWEYIAKSKSFTRGSLARRVYDADALLYAENGTSAFSGVSGVIASVFDLSFVDDKINVNENFIFVNVSEEGLRNLKKFGGIHYYNQLLKSVWEKTNKLTNEELIALENYAARLQLSKSNLILSDLSVEVAHQLSDPFLEQSAVYVHPVGVKSFAWHILRLARLNRRTPYEIRLYQDPIHGELYDRWIRFQLDQCEKR